MSARTTPTREKDLTTNVSVIVQLLTELNCEQLIASLVSGSYVEVWVCKWSVSSADSEYEG